MCGRKEAKQPRGETQKTGNYTFFPNKNAFANMESAISKYNPTLNFGFSNCKSENF